MKDWQAFLDLKKKIDDFNETCPLLEMMSNKAMLERHWQRIGALTKKTFDIESDTFTLGIFSKTNRLWFGHLVILSKGS